MCDSYFGGGLAFRILLLWLVWKSCFCGPTTGAPSPRLPPLSRWQPALAGSRLWPRAVVPWASFHAARVAPSSPRRARRGVECCCFSSCCYFGGGCQSPCPSPRPPFVLRCSFVGCGSAFGTLALSPCLLCPLLGLLSVRGSRPCAATPPCLLRPSASVAARAPPPFVAVMKKRACALFFSGISVSHIFSYIALYCSSFVNFSSTPSILIHTGYLCSLLCSGGAK